MQRSVHPRCDRTSGHLPGGLSSLPIPVPLGCWEDACPSPRLTGPWSEGKVEAWLGCPLPALLAGGEDRPLEVLRAEAGPG